MGFGFRRFHKPPHGVNHAPYRQRYGAENTRQNFGEAFLCFQAAKTACGVSCLKLLMHVFIYLFPVSLFLENYFRELLASQVL